MVGCVIVNRDRVVAEGFHAEYGGPHAEVVALQKAGAEARDGTVYVSLEPCDHVGQTGPCSQALIAAGVARVVFAVADPTPNASGGARSLREAGIAVTGPVFDARIGHQENPAFFYNAEHGAPYVALKLAMSLDAKLSATEGERTAITGSESADFVHDLRAGFDAVLIGARTARVDDPRLTVRRGAPAHRQPHRIVLDGNATVRPGARLFEDVEASPVHLLVSSSAPKDRVQRLIDAGALVREVPTSSAGTLDLDAAFDHCWSLGLRSVLCEGGARLASSLLSVDRAQRMYLLIAARFIGPSGVAAFPDVGSVKAAGWRPVDDPIRLGGDVLITLDRED
jgi:diaminohydroxyphosphoribosylaminopyrimidine deaminase/5-amino-6-(5-phosphoribosylamino)uracil reductase